MPFDVMWRGASGTQYTFTAYPDNQQFNPVSAVYIFFSDRVRGLYGPQALYVGEAQSLQQRLNAGITNHDGYRRAKLKGMTHIAALTVVGDANRKRVELDLIHALNPICNIQGVNSLGSIGFPHLRF